MYQPVMTNLLHMEKYHLDTDIVRFISALKYKYVPDFMSSDLFTFHEVYLRLQFSTIPDTVSGEHCALVASRGSSGES